MKKGVKKSKKGGANHSEAVLERTVEVLYLDTDRLNSYASQLGGGLVSARRLLEEIRNKRVENPVVRTEENTKRSGASGNASVGVVGGEVDRGEAKTQRTQASGPTYEDETGILEDIAQINHDNLMLSVEEQLLKTGKLIEFKGHISKTGLYRFEGPIKLFDWALVAKIFKMWSSLALLSDDVSGMTDTINESQAIAINSLLESFSINQVLASMKSERRVIQAVLSEKYLRLDRDQLQFTFPDAFDVTMIGFVAKHKDSDLPSEGVLDKLDFTALYKELLGEVYRTVLPVCIYVELK